jgi:hypothetical protein
MGSDAKSYMKKGFLICEEMRKNLTIHEEAVSHMHPILWEFLMYEGFFQCTVTCTVTCTGSEVRFIM